MSENVTIAEHLREIVRNHDAARKERDDLEERLRLLQGVSGGDLDAGVEQLAAARAAQRELQEKLATSEEQVDATRRSLRKSHEDASVWKEEIAKTKAENGNLLSELAEGRKALDEALSSVSLLTADKKKLLGQVDDLINRYRTAEAALAKSSRELQFVTMAMERAQAALGVVTSTADAKLQKVQETALKERTILVTAALRSLQQLRSHLTTTLSGLHVQPAERSVDGPEAWRKWKAHWGVTAPSNEPLVVKLLPPPKPPLNVSKYEPSPRPSSALASTRSPRRLRAVSTDTGTDIAAAMENALANSGLGGGAEFSRVMMSKRAGDSPIIRPISAGGTPVSVQQPPSNRTVAANAASMQFALLRPPRR